VILTYTICLYPRFNLAYNVRKLNPYPVLKDTSVVQMQAVINWTNIKESYNNVVQENNIINIVYFCRINQE